MILESVIENLTTEGLLGTTTKSHVILGYSGGKDSTALLFLLSEIREKLPLTVTAAYFNHRWRHTPAEELPLIHQNCEDSKTPLVIIQGDLSLPKTENAARYARYQQLTRLASDLRAQAVLTAHHADDQVETILFRLLRGTGVDGLSGIRKRLILDADWGPAVPIVRPLLDTARKNIQAYVLKKKLPHFDDPTNDDTHYQRNKLRHDVIPFLEKAFPQMKNSLFRLGLVSKGDLEIIDDSLETLWLSLHHVDQSGSYLDGLIFNQLGLPYQRRILRRFLNLHDIHSDFQSIEALLSFVRGEGRKNWDAALKSIPYPHRMSFADKLTPNDKPGIDNKSAIKSPAKPYFLSLYKNKLRIIPGEKLKRIGVKTTKKVSDENKNNPPDNQTGLKMGNPVGTPPIEITPPAINPVVIPGLTHMTEPMATLHILPWDAPEQVRFSPIRPNDQQQAYVDLSAFLDKPLEWRTRRPGDRFQPLGMGVPLKFKRFLINRGVPRFERDSIPLLTHGQLILWVPGLGINQAIKIKDQERPTHLLKVSRNTECFSS